MTDNIRRVVESWRINEIELWPGLEPETIRTQFSHVGLSLSADIELLYSLCGGMKRNEIDDSWFELWPIKRVIAESAKFPNGLLPFAEGFISAHLYCLHVENKSEAAVLIDYSCRGENPEVIANSFDEAFGYLLSDPGRLHLPSR